MPRLVALLCLVVPIAACKGDPANSGGSGPSASQATECDGLNQISLAYIDGLMQTKAGTDLDESVKDAGRRAEVIAECKRLPATMFACAKRVALSDPACDRHMEAYLGMASSEPSGKGPKPRWEVDLPFEPFEMAVGGDGHILLAGAKSVGLVDSDGALGWSKEVEDLGESIGWLSDCALVPAGTELRCYSVEGEVTWTTTLAEEQPVRAIGAGPGEAATVVGASGLVARLEAERCAMGGPECPATVITASELSGAMAVDVDDDGALMITTSKGVGYVTGEGELIALVDGEAGAGRDGMVTVDRDVWRINPTCEPFEPDCWRKLATNSDLSFAAPLQIGDYGYVFADTYGVVYMEGRIQWKVDGGNDGDPVSDGETVYTIGHVLGLSAGATSAPPQVRAISAKTGETRWIAPLGDEPAGMLSSYSMTRVGGELFVATPKHLFALPIPGA